MKMNRIVAMGILAGMVALMAACGANRPDNTVQDSLKAEQQALRTDPGQPSGMQAGKPVNPAMASSTDLTPAQAQPAVQQKSWPDKPVELNTAAFKQQVFDMDKNPTQWVYKGELPAIVDFYAVWCGPCKMAAPALEELAKEYSGKVHIYKVDAEKERYLSNYFRVTGYPSFLLIPAKGQPRMFTGLPPGVRVQADIKPAFKKIIENELL